MRLSYVLPLRSSQPLASPEFAGYLAALSKLAEVLVVDGSASDVFVAHAAQWRHVVRHLPVDADLVSPMGKVGGVLTGVRHASHERVVIADDDVRYSAASLRAVAARLSASTSTRTCSATSSATSSTTR